MTKLGNYFFVVSVDRQTFWGFEITSNSVPHLLHLLLRKHSAYLLAAVFVKTNIFLRGL